MPCWCRLPGANSTPSMLALRGAVEALVAHGQHRRIRRSKGATPRDEPRVNSGAVESAATREWDRTRPDADFDRVPELDWLKGLAVLFVVAIHAKPFQGTFVFNHLIDRAVPIFLVLFGVSAELWWQREDARGREDSLRRWYVERLRRMMPGYWAAVAVWWFVLVTVGTAPEKLTLGLPQFALNLLGWSPWMTTAWFVFMILQYLLIFPALRRVTLKIGGVASLGLALAATVASGLSLFAIINATRALIGDNVRQPPWYYHWVFAPRVLWHITAGMFIARFWRARLSLPVTLAALLLTVVAIACEPLVRGAPDDISGSIRALTFTTLIDVPLTVALLGLLRWTPLPSLIRRVLAWFGHWSWGIYIGHILVYEVLATLRFVWEAGDNQERMKDYVVLLAGGIGLAVLGQRLRSFAAPRIIKARAD